MSTGRGGAEREIAVVGAGLLGLSAAWALARRGRDVTVLEQATVGHPGSGSKGSCRIFRLGYADPRYVEAAQRARGLWQALETDYRRQLLFPAPQLTFGAGADDVRRAMQRAGARCEVLAPAEAAARFRGVVTGGPALLEPESAVIAADQALAALAAAVADLRTGVPVTGLADDGRRVTLHTAQGPVAAQTAVICAGPWTSGLLAGLGVALPGTASSDQVAYLATGSDRAELPIFLCHGAGDPGKLPYGLPVPGAPLYKIGIHSTGPAVHPDRQPDEADPALLGPLAQLARQYLPGLDPRPARTERCTYDNSPDEDFVLDRIGNVVIGCGTSGHGFKFGPLIGEWLAELALGESPAGDADPPWLRFALARFTAGT